VKTLMRRMGIEALYRRPRTTMAEPGYKIYPYCCVGWRSPGRTKSGRWTSRTSRWRVASSISPWVLDWFSRRVLSWRLSITMEAAFCVETLEDAMARHGKPEVF
jgi:putative transposase